MRRTLERHQVAIYLSAFVVGGLAGLLSSRLSEAAGHLVTPALGALLFLTFLQVPVAGLVTAWRDWRFVLALLAVNFVAVPAVVAMLTIVMPDSNPVRLGMLIVLLCPCVDYVIVFSGLGHGLIDADTARTLLAEARRNYIHPDHENSARAALRYPIPKKLAALVKASELCCAFPGCTNKVFSADIDHRKPFNHARPASGGLTVRRNLRPVPEAIDSSRRRHCC
ncbi:hypothetical protein [Gordonia otitidis]|uniref:DUF222 domain-containing protein n=1 Tax=Gordonia otitidis (strain DSM 44809 / CCUG 52243 / JCM 12355 / NBRC 100426 / IFM 10032) TaxID=1108044 RepID=H5TUD9_GORO1|nr:hypothetical protein [Gordonia otitidis]GAB37097.1 hypothetical protein GOOTI_257_00090 [Gordonia otitidis NBRC 100426]